MRSKDEYLRCIADLIFNFAQKDDWCAAQTAIYWLLGEVWKMALLREKE